MQANPAGRSRSAPNGNAAPKRAPPRAERRTRRTTRKEESVERVRQREATPAKPYAGGAATASGRCGGRNRTGADGGEVSDDRRRPQSVVTL